MKLNALMEQYRGERIGKCPFRRPLRRERIWRSALRGWQCGSSCISPAAAKPFQAIPVMQHQVVEKFGLTGEEAALFAASQRGEAYQLRH